MEKPKLREGLPANARLVFQGVVFEVWQWEQKMFDGTTKTFEKVWRPPTVLIIATVGDQILIEHQDQPDRPGNINFVSGRPEPGEEVLTAAQRELLEETGYQSADWHLLMKHGPDGKVLHESDYFIARDCRKIQEPHLDSGERIEMRLISFDEMMKLSEEPKFWTPPQFIVFLLRLKADPKKLEEFRRTLFGKAS
jgi:ADP-ribose pyrophosphatase